MKMSKRTKMKLHLAGLAAVAAVAASGAGSTNAFGCGTNPHECGNGGGNQPTEARPGCGYGDTRPHTGPPGQMSKGGFDKDQPANPGGAKECPEAAGKG